MPYHPLTKFNRFISLKGGFAKNFGFFAPNFSSYYKNVGTPADFLGSILMFLLIISHSLLLYII